MRFVLKTKKKERRDIVCELRYVCTVRAVFVAQEKKIKFQNIRDASSRTTLVKVTNTNEIERITSEAQDIIILFISFAFFN